MLPWPRMAEDLPGTSLYTGKIWTSRKGVSIHSEEASAKRNALSMSSGSYPGFAIQEPVHQKRRKFITAPKFSSSGKPKQYAIQPVMEQLRGLPKSYDEVRKMRSRACWSEGGVVQ